MSKRDTPDPAPLDALARYLKNGGWKAKKLKSATAYMVEGKNALCEVKYYFQVVEDLDQLLFYIAPEINVVKELLPEVAEYVCRANHGMRIGGFDLDFNDGQISFRSSVNFKGLPLSETLIDNAVKPALTAFDEFFPGLARVIAGVDTPAAAIRKIEYG